MQEEYLNALNLFSYLGPRRIGAALKQLGTPQRVWSASLKELKLVPGWDKIADDFVHQRKHLDVNKEWFKLEEKGVRIITPSHSVYPRWLREIPFPPPLLYLKGDLHADECFISIVGSRKCTLYGKEVAGWLASELAQNGFNIVSGMALGIDACAHSGALKHGRTVAVLGSGLANIYPQKNANLSKKIVNQGALLTEFPLDVKPLAHNFPQRNRIISGMSLGTLVVEALQKSGALITSNYALEQGREVFAVPGNINSPYSKGCHSLLKQGAKLVETVQDVLDELPLEIQSQLIFHQDYQKISNTEKKLAKEEEEYLLSLIPYHALHVDRIIQMSGYSSATVGNILLQLELKGLVKQLPGKYFLKS